MNGCKFEDEDENDDEEDSPFPKPQMIYSRESRYIRYIVDNQ
jgi:hypothetical protein